MTRNTICSECGGEMKEGFIPDISLGGIFRLAWVEGKPKKGLLAPVEYDF